MVLLLQRISIYRVFFRQVQAAQYQQGLNSAGKASPRTPTTPTGTAPARPLLNNSTGQNAITVKNAQVR